MGKVKSSKNEFLKELTWAKLTISLTNTRRIPGAVPFYLLVNSIIKDVTNIVAGSYDNQHRIFFHLPDRKFGFKPKLNLPQRVEIYFCNNDIEISQVWQDALLQYFDIPENRKNVTLNTVESFELIKFEDILENTDIDFSINEVCLLFLTPLGFPLVKKNIRTFIDEDTFVKIFNNRLINLFQINRLDIDTSRFTILPYYWNYTEQKKMSVSQQGHIQYIKGCMGKLYIKGDLTELMPLLILGSHIHTGTKISNALGYYKLYDKPVAHFDPLICNYDYIDSVFDNLYEEQQDNEKLIFIEDNLTEILLEEIVSGTYKPEKPEVFSIPKGNGEHRTIEKPIFKDHLVYKCVHDALFKVFDKTFEESSIGYRKGRGRQDAIKKINDAIAEGYCYIVESDIEDFFPSVDQRKLYDILQKLLPDADQITLKLLKTIIIGQNSDFSRGIPLGYPTSPLFANIYLDSFDEEFHNSDKQMIRFADDFIILTKTYEEAESILEETHKHMDKIGLSLNINKTSIKHIEDGFNFLGYNFTGDGMVVDNSVEESPYRKPLFITEPFVFISVQGERLEVRKNKEIINSVPLNRISEVLILDQASFSSFFVSKCIDRNIPISMTLRSGYYITTIKPDSRKYFDIANQHASKFFNITEAERFAYAQEFAIAKISNYISFIKKRRISKEGFERLVNIIEEIKKSENVNEIRGYEGQAAKLCFSLINETVKYEEFKAEKRGRKEPDFYNGLLNFGYYLLFSRVNSLIRSVGLNPYLGFLHSEINDYESLVADVQEPFRVFVDRAILRMINLKVITPNDFKDHNKRKYLTHEARKKFLYNFEKEFANKATVRSRSLLDMLAVQVFNIKRWVVEDVPFKVFRWEE